MSSATFPEREDFKRTADSLRSPSHFARDVDSSMGHYAPYTKPVKASPEARYSPRVHPSFSPLSYLMC